MLVVVAAVYGVAVAVMHVVEVVTVQYGGVAAGIPVDMVVALGNHVLIRRALVVVIAGREEAWWVSVPAG